MASDINPNLIDGSYPVAGQDNNSQGFRDNFTNIRTNFQFAEDEINDLESNAILKAPLTGTTLDNNMNDALLVAAKIQDFSATKAAIAATSGTVLVNYASGHYQTVTTSGSISLSFSNFPANGSYGWLRLQVNITNVAHTLTLPAAVNQGLLGIQGISPGIPGVTNVITFGVTGAFEFEFTTSDGGTTITLFDLNRALTNFAAADLSLGDVTATGFVSAAGNITGGNIVTAGQVLATGNITGGNVVGFLRPVVGTGTQAPLVFASGSLVTNTVSSPVGGSVEYDGTVFYGTPTVLQRGIIPVEHYVVLSSNYTGLNSAVAQKVFNTPTNGAITLAPDTSYFMEAQYVLTRTLGTNAHTVGVLFATSGTLTSIMYTAETTDATSNSLGTVSRIFGTSLAETVVTASSGNSTQFITVKLSGVVRTNSGGTFTPQFKYNSAPGGAPTVAANSYFRLTPIGNSTVTNVGNWS